jgi:protoheme IX farnesyltransferase
VFLLACGAAALNQVEEAAIDARMSRTRGRPIPSGRISREWALFVVLLLVGAGATLLASVEGRRLEVLALGGLALVWYNGIYILLKRVTAFAVVPGSLVGAIPPAIGWAAAGGHPLDPRILEVAGFFFLWQIPHFWLLLFLFGRDYEEAGLPTLSGRVSPAQFGRITFAWIVAAAAAGIAVGVRARLAPPWILLVTVATLWLVLASVAVLRRPEDRAVARRLFLKINGYAFAVMLALSGDALA